MSTVPPSPDVPRHTLSIWDRFAAIEQDIELIFKLIQTVEPIVEPLVNSLSTGVSAAQVSVVPTPVIPPGTNTTESDALKTIFGKP